jgi:thiamine kinase-like enzyme
MKVKTKVDLNEKYPVREIHAKLDLSRLISFLSFSKFLFQISKATESYQQLVEQGLPQLMKFLEQKADYDNEIEALASIRPKTKKLIEGLLQPVEPIGLITHTDFWCNNLLFKDDAKDDNCIILDWQMVTYSRPTNDIALLITSSLPSDVRRENSQKLLDLYHNSLKTNCAKLNIDLEIDLQYSRNKLECDFRYVISLCTPPHITVANTRNLFYLIPGNHNCWHCCCASARLT